MSDEHLLQRLELAIQGSGFGMWEYNIATGEMAWDEQMCAIFGVDAKTFVPTRVAWRNLMHPDDRVRNMVRFDEALNGKTSGLFESRYLKPDGSIGYIEGIGRAQMGPDGKPTFLFGLNREITERKNAERHLAVVARTMTQIAERQPLSVVLNSIVEYYEATHVSVFCSVLLLDPATESFLLGAGPKVGSFYDEVIKDIKIGPEVGSCGAAAFLGQRVIVEDIMTDSKWDKFRAAASKLGIVSSWSEPIMVGDKVLGTFAIHHLQRQLPTRGDLQMIEACAQLAGVAIEYRRTEETLELQQAKLLSSIKMAALGEMASGIAHEVNNPLTIIVGKAWQLKKQIDDGAVDLSVFSEELARIVDVSNRIAKVVKGLQSFSRNADKDPFERVQIQQVVEDALELSNERFRNHGISLKLQIESKDLIVAARPAQLTQVMLNLLNNAFDAVSPLDERWVEITVVARERTAFISVVDSGRGLPANVAEKMMQPFFTTKGVGKGTGLGLSISKGIAEEHQGRLYYDPSSVRTRFVLELPLDLAL